MDIILKIIDFTFATFSNWAGSSSLFGVFRKKKRRKYKRKRFNKK